MLDVFLAATIMLVLDPQDRRQVLDATFASYLAQAPCPAIPGIAHARSWNDLDVLQDYARARGWFIPGAISGVAGSFTRPGAVETLYTIEVRECVENGFHHDVDVVFAASPSRASRVVVLHDYPMGPRSIRGTRVRAGAVDEVAFVSGTATTWKHLVASGRTWIWQP